LLNERLPSHAIQTPWKQKKERERGKIRFGILNRSACKYVSKKSWHSNSRNQNLRRKRSRRKLGRKRVQSAAPKRMDQITKEKKKEKEVINRNTTSRQYQVRHLYADNGLHGQLGENISVTTRRKIVRLLHLQHRRLHSFRLRLVTLEGSSSRTHANYRQRSGARHQLAPECGSSYSRPTILSTSATR
jgi:hypothetical protein